MIIDAFLFIIFAFVFALTAIFRLAPDVTLPAAATDAIATASGYISAVNAFFPVDTLVFVFLGIFLVYEGAYFGYKLVMWVIRKIPTIS